MVRQLSAGAVRAQHSRSYIVQSRREEKAPGLELTLALRLGGRRLQRLEDSDNLPTMKLHVKAGHEVPGGRVKGSNQRCGCRIGVRRSETLLAAFATSAQDISSKAQALRSAEVSGFTAAVLAARTGTSPRPNASMVSAMNVLTM